MNIPEIASKNISIIYDFILLSCHNSVSEENKSAQLAAKSSLMSQYAFFLFLGVT